jgi:hypothetical protein
MKNIFFALSILFSMVSFSQVGINTTSPSTTLDVNGDLRVRNLSGGTMVSDDMGNLATVPFKVVAAGKIHPNGTPIKITGATITRVNKGDYSVSFSSILPNSHYIVMMSIKDCGGNCDGNNNYDDPGISYYDQTASGFRINIGDSDNGNSAKTDIDLEFMFIVYAI